MIPRKATICLLALGMLPALCGILSAGTHTISWAPVATYADGTAIAGKAVTYSVYWSPSESLNSLTMFAYGLTQTSKTFNTAALGMRPGSRVYFTLRTTLGTGETSGYATPMPWFVPLNSTGASADQDGNEVRIDLSGPLSPWDVRINKQDSARVRETWRLSWRAVTELANGQELGPGRIVRYNVYWTRDPSLAAANRIELATSVYSAHVDFQPLQLGMENHEKVYFTVQAILDTGEQSSLSGRLPWRVSSKGPAAPTQGKIGKD